MRTLLVIPARIGSTRIERKNLQGIYSDGDTLLRRAIRCAQSYGWYCKANPEHIVRSVVSTDSEEIAGEVPTEECHSPSVIARAVSGDGPMAPVLLEAACAMADSPQTWDAIVCLQPTSPFRTAFDVARALAVWRARPVDSLVSVNEETGKRNGAIYITHLAMLRDGLVFDERLSVKVPMPADRSLDINEPADLELARKIAKERGW